jgi:hypothetical protein
MVLLPSPVKPGLAAVIQLVRANDSVILPMARDTPPYLTHCPPGPRKGAWGVFSVSGVCDAPITRTRYGSLCWHRRRSQFAQRSPASQGSACGWAMPLDYRLLHDGQFLESVLLEHARAVGRRDRWRADGRLEPVVGLHGDLLRSTEQADHGGHSRGSVASGG